MVFLFNYLISDVYMEEGVRQETVLWSGVVFQFFPSFENTFLYGTDPVSSMAFH